tara:strand:- start:1307 stop:3103 length:1797 start_codon:yes stop_codon:yes gene_type:complete
MADVKNFGLKGISNDVQLGKSGGRFKWSSANDRYEFTGADGSTLKAIRAANVDVQGTLLSNDITAASVSVNGDAVITGDLTVNGSTTTVSSTNTTIADSILELATGTTGTPANDVGLVIERGDSNNVFIGWDESEDKVVAGTGTFTGSSTGSLTITAADFEAADVKGSSFTGASGASITAFLDDDTMASASATTGATSESVKAYVDAQTTDETAEGSTNLYFTNTRADARITNALIDEDNMASDSATKLPSQQSVKAFVDGEVSTLNTAITTANTGLKAYVDALDRDDDLAFTGDDGTGRTLDLDAATLTIAGGTGITSASGASSVTLGLDNTAVTGGSYGSATAVATFTVDAQGRLTAAGEASITTSLTIQSDDAADNVVALATDKLKLLGGTNITSTNTADDVTFNLDSTLSGLTAVNSAAVTASGTVEFGSLSDGTVTLTAFTAEGTGIAATDNDTTVPTSAAVKDYVDNNGGDGLTKRASFTANSSDATFDIGTVPNVSGRTYYASRVILDVTTLLAGGSVDGMVVKDNGGSGNTLVAATANDIAVGTYVVDLPFASALTKNASVQVQFVQSNGSTAATPTAGVVVGVVEYKYV